MSYNYSRKQNHEDPLLFLDFHHHTILVRCNESFLLQKLREEFHFFVKDNLVEAETEIDLLIDPSPEIPSMVATKLLENAVVYRHGPVQYVDYFGDALTIWDKSQKKVRIFSTDLNRLYELAFLAVHSLLGQELDTHGICRLHAVAISIKSVNAIVMLPSKGGKSTLLQNFIKNPDVKIISDDMPLCDSHGRIHPFPSKISLSEVPSQGPLANLDWHEFKRHHYPPKWTAGLGQLKDRLELQPEKNQNILVAGYRLSNGASRLEKVSRWKMIPPMFEHMILGMGLPQIIELFLRFDISDIVRLPRHAIMRSICAFNLVRNSHCYYFYMGPEKTRNAQLLLDVIYERQSS